MLSGVFNKTVLPPGRYAVTVGVFDGMHAGHLKVIGETVSYARKNGMKSVAVTFSTNPKMLVKTKIEARPLLTDYMTEKYLEKTGIDFHLVIDFSAEMSKLTGVEFSDLLYTSCRTGALLIGKDFRCGNSRASLDANGLKEVFRRYEVGVPVIVIDPVTDRENRVISSSLIRAMLSQGETAQAAALLGRPYCLSLPDAKEEKDGRILYPADSFVQFLPKEGIYKATAVAENGSPAQVEVTVSGSCLSFQLPESATTDTELLFFQG